MKETYFENNLAVMGAREHYILAETLKAYAEGKVTQLANDYFVGENVKFAFNANSGNVFLVDDECNVLMLNGDKLDLWLSSPDLTCEGFLDDLMGEYEYMSNEDKEWIDQFKEYVAK